MTDAELVRHTLSLLRDHIAELGESDEAAPLFECLEALAKRLEGGVIVPREPTEATIDAMCDAHLRTKQKYYAPLMREIYSAMLQAQEEGK